MVDVTEIFVPSKYSTTTYYDRYNDPWFRKRFDEAEGDVLMNNLHSFAKLRESLDSAEEDAKIVFDIRRVQKEIMMMKAKERLESLNVA
ncbi:hypothetical protein ACLB2K_006236 [Fragaria x ananassa]